MVNQNLKILAAKHKKLLKALYELVVEGPEMHLDQK